MIETIGVNAGRVWSILDAKGRQNVKDVKTETKLTDKYLFAALGWLAREGKISFEEKGKDLFVSLK